MTALLVVLMVPAFAEPLGGTWRVDIEAASTSEAMWIESRTGLHTVGVLRWDGDTTRYRVCDLRPDGGVVRTVIPQAWISSLAEREVHASLEADRVRIDLGTSSVGFDPRQGPLASVDLDAAIDQDGDGDPGVTLAVWVPLLGDGEVYVAEQSSIRLAGLLLDATHVEGRVDVESAHVVLGATPAVLARQANVRALPSQSWFTLTAVPAAATCDDFK